MLTKFKTLLQFTLGGMALVVVLSGSDAVPFREETLGTRSRPAGGTLFTPLAPEETGIIAENSYADPKMWGERYQEFALGAIGTGVTIGDFDNDGRPDVFIVSKTGPSRLFRNLGGWKFADVTARAGLVNATEDVSAWKQGATFADINNDGWLDLYLCRYAAPNLLYVNQGNGTFREEAAARGLAVVDASGMAAFCDYDRDGWLDLYLQTNMLNAVKSPGGQRDFLFRNKGDGTFEDVTVRAGISGENLAHSATWWDFDQDGWPDLYVANDFGPADRLYRNQRNGTFVNVIHQVVPQMPYSAMGADFGDVNNDGLPDLFVADMATTSHDKDQRGMASSRELTREDSDSPALAPQILRNTLYLNAGTGRMLEGAALTGLAATDWTWSTRFEDLDNDGRLDLHITNGMNREYQNADLRDRIILMENEVERLRIMKASPVLNEANLAYRNMGDLLFREVGKDWGLDQVGVSFGSAFGDLDGDGDLDLVFANYDARPSVLRNDSATGHRVIFALRGTRSNRFGVGATVRIKSQSGTQMRTLVLARGYLSSSEPVLHFGLGDDERILHVTIEWPSGHVQSFENLPTDRKFTITEPEGPPPVTEKTIPPQAQFEQVASANGLAFTVNDRLEQESSPQPLRPLRFDRRGPALAVNELNGDGKDDVVVGGTAQEGLRILVSSPNGHAETVRLPVAAVDDGPVVIFDADGDGDNDLLRTKGGMGRPAVSTEYQPRLHLNDGLGSFSPAPDGAMPALALSAGAAAVVDFDRDGRLDVFLGARVLPGKYPQSPRSALLRNRGGTFEDVTDTLAPALREVGMVTSALWSDVDNDGWSDLLVALEWGSVKYFHNDEGKAFTDRSAAAGFATAGTGWWMSLGSADFNGDGRPDFVAGNQGLNSIYQASATHPTLLYYGRFGTGGLPQIIEAYHEGERLLPRRTLRAIGGFVPAMKRRFTKNDDFAKATLGEILGDDKLAAAQRFAATELRSGVFLSQPDGTYRFAPLPRIAQIAPFQGVVAGDFDGDGRADIYAVQNDYAPIPSIGRFDGGVSQLLRGDGRGNFTPVTPLASGLLVPGDAKALAVLDLDNDGWPDFLLSRNSASSLAWRNRGVLGHRSFGVRLQGPIGNPTAIGARVTVAYADGSRQSAEVQAGSGYYSQSSAVLFFGYLESNQPKAITVRWPEGHESTHEWSLPDQGTMQLVHP